MENVNRTFSKENIDYTLYLITNREILKGRSLEEAVEEAIIGGVTLVQIREKDAGTREFYEVAMGVKKITDKYKVPLIINDRVDIALAVDAAGVHVGQSDMKASIVRKLIGKNKIIGVSAGNLKEAKEAKEDGADYLGVGSMFCTSTKKDAVDVSFHELAEIRDNVEMPIVTIGGIDEKNILKFKNTGIQGVSVISTILDKKDIKSQSQKLRELLKVIVK